MGNCVTPPALVISKHNDRQAANLVFESDAHSAPLERSWNRSRRNSIAGSFLVYGRGWKASLLQILFQERIAIPPPARRLFQGPTDPRAVDALRAAITVPSVSS